jgi:hypothetical protein
LTRAGQRPDRVQTGPDALFADAGPPLGQRWPNASPAENVWIPFTHFWTHGPKAAASGLPARAAAWCKAGANEV